MHITYSDSLVFTRDLWRHHRVNHLSANIFSTCLFPFDLLHILCTHLFPFYMQWWLDIGIKISYHLVCLFHHRLMPFLILSGQLCPPGIEGTLFALFMSINNFGSTVGSFVGAGLASLLNVSSGSFDNLLLGIVIQVICTYIPVALLFLIPKEATGVST